MVYFSLCPMVTLLSLLFLLCDWEVANKVKTSCKGKWAVRSVITHLRTLLCLPICFSGYGASFLFFTPTWYHFPNPCSRDNVCVCWYVSHLHLFKGTNLMICERPMKKSLSSIKAWSALTKEQVMVRPIANMTPFKQKQTKNS